MKLNIEFNKYHGNGNDFIIVDNRDKHMKLSGSVIAFLCDRHFGIGADGLMLLEEFPGFDFFMRYYNSDGNESTMCGNGGRCIAAYARKLGITAQKSRFRAIDGDHEAEILSEQGEISIIKLKMMDTMPGPFFEDGYLIDTGSPHFITYVPSVKEVDIIERGRALRHEKRFAPGGCNVNFVEITDSGISVRTYERGVEGETLSCGTGATAAALVTASVYGNAKGFCSVNTEGGQLKVHFRQSDRQFTEVYLEGQAAFVFKGEIKSRK